MTGNNRQVAHAFAAGSGPTQGSNLYHDNRVCYSYGSHWPLAVKLDDSRVLVNNDRYSATTSKHRSYVAGALAVEGWQIIASDLAECLQATYDPTYQPAQVA